MQTNKYQEGGFCFLGKAVGVEDRGSFLTIVL